MQVIKRTGTKGRSYAYCWAVFEAKFLCWVAYGLEERTKGGMEMIEGELKFVYEDALRIRKGMGDDTGVYVVPPQDSI